MSDYDETNGAARLILAVLVVVGAWLAMTLLAAGLDWLQSAVHLVAAAGSAS